jgi:hypothetical protein
MDENKLVLSLNKLKRIRHSVMHTQEPDLLKHANLAPGGRSKTDRHSQSIEKNILKKIYLDQENSSNTENLEKNEKSEKNENYIKNKNSTKFTSDIQEPFPLLNKLTSRLAPNNSKGFLNNVMENYKVYSDVIQNPSDDIDPQFQYLTQQEQMKIRERKEWSDKHIPKLINKINFKENLKTKIISRLEMNTISSEFNSIRPIKPLNVKGEKLEKILILNRNLYSIKHNKNQKKIEILSKKKDNAVNTVNTINTVDEKVTENNNEDFYITSSNFPECENTNFNLINHKSNFSTEKIENQENCIKSCSSIKSVHMKINPNVNSIKFNTTGNKLFVKKNELKDKIMGLNPNPSSVVSSNGFENCNLQIQIEDLFHYNLNTRRSQHETFLSHGMTSRGDSTSYSPKKKAGVTTFENFKSLSLLSSNPGESSNFNNSKINYNEFSFSPNQKKKLKHSSSSKIEKLEKLDTKISINNKPNFKKYKYDYSVNQNKLDADKKIMKKFSDFMNLKNREKVIKQRMATKLCKDNLRYVYNPRDSQSQSQYSQQTQGQGFNLKNLKNFKIKSKSQSQENFCDLKFMPKLRDSNKTVSVMTMTLTENYEK